MPFVLILDGHGTNRRILARLAESVGPEVSVATFGDPAEALAWIASHDADLVITGYRLAQEDGAEVARRIRAMPRTAEVPVLVVSRSEDRQFRLLALDAGATDFLLAPVDEVEFRARVRNLLALRRYQTEARQRAEQPRQQPSERPVVPLLRDSREALAQLADAIPAQLTVTDREGRLLFVNAAQAASVARSRADLEGRKVTEVFGADRARMCLELDRQVFDSGEALPGFEETILGPEGRRVSLLTSKSPLHGRDGKVAAVLSTSVDITERKRAEERLLHLVLHDQLTGLPNRAFLRERLREQCRRERRPKDGFALHLLDLDRFKAINDGLGHEAGDQLLVQVARRLRAAVPDADLVARLGGDEFAIIQDHVRTEGEAERLAARIMQIYREPFQIGQRSISVVASLGVTLFPRDTGFADELLRNADMAMYRVKRSGGAGFRFFERQMDAAAQQAMALEGELRRALDRREFELLWQPQVSLRTGRISGAEALLRWRHAERGIIPPAEFLHLAEETGLIAPITEWALATACAEAAKWAKQRPAGLRISANLSPSLFASRNVRDLVLDALATSGLPPSLLDLEITERALVDNVEAMASTLRSLRDIGVTFSIDDFGTGYSSLTHAKTFPVQRLKVDQSFIANLDADAADAAIVGAIVSLAHGLGLEAVAEGVETAEQVAALRRIGCDEVQGHFVREPVTAAELTAMLDADLAHLAGR